MSHDNFQGTCRTCGRAVVWIRKQHRPGKTPVLPLRRNGDPVDPRDEYREATHIRHLSTACAEQGPPQKIGAPAPSGAPPAAMEMDDPALRAAIEHYRGLSVLGRKQQARLGELLAEQERRQIEAGKKILTMSPHYDWREQ